MAGCGVDASRRLRKTRGSGGREEGEERCRRVVERGREGCGCWGKGENKDKRMEGSSRVTE